MRVQIGDGNMPADADVSNDVFGEMCAPRAENEKIRQIMEDIRIHIIRMGKAMLELTDGAQKGIEKADEALASAVTAQDKLGDAVTALNNFTGRVDGGSR